MKRINKVLVASAFLALATIEFISADELAFKNEISTDTFYAGDISYFTKARDDSGYHRFPGITEKIAAEYSSEKVDAKVELSFDFFGYNNRAYNSDQIRFEKKTIIGLTGIVFDGYVKFRPIEILQLSVNSKEYASGSYFPVLDKNVNLGNYTGDFGLLLKPIDGLYIGAGINLGTVLFSDFKDKDFYYDPNTDAYTDYDPDQIYLNFGAEYTYENIGTLAITLNNITNNVGFGAYAKITAIKDMNIFAGLSFQKNQQACINGLETNRRTAYDIDADVHKTTAYYSYKVNGNTLMNAGLEYSGINKLYLAADFATNFLIEADRAYDLYAGFKANYEINEMISVGGSNYMVFDLADSHSDDNDALPYAPFISLCPEGTVKFGNHTFKAGLRLEFCDGNFLYSLPVSWTYAF